MLAALPDVRDNVLVLAALADIGDYALVLTALPDGVRVDHLRSLNTGGSSLPKWRQRGSRRDHQHCLLRQRPCNSSANYAWH